MTGIQGKNRTVIKLLLFTCIVSLLAVGATNSNVLGPLPKVTSMADGPLAGVPFDIGSLKRNWRSRIEAIRSSGELPIIDIESSFDVRAFNPAQYAKLMDDNAIALIAFSPQARGWTEDARVVVAIDPWRYIPTTIAGIPPAWPKDGEQFLAATATHVAKDRYPLMGEFEFHHYPSPRQLKRGQTQRDLALPIDGELGHRLFRLSEETGISFQIHYEIEDQLLPPLEKMLKQYPKAKVIWCHLAQIRYSDLNTIYGPAYVRKLIENHPNLYFDIAFGGPDSRYPGSREFHATIWDRSSGGVKKDWAQLISDHPWRFLAALDIGGDRMDTLGEKAQDLHRFLAALPPKTAEIVATKAAWKLLFNEDL